MRTPSSYPAFGLWNILDLRTSVTLGGRHHIDKRVERENRKGQRQAARTSPPPARCPAPTAGVYPSNQGFFETSSHPNAALAPTFEGVQGGGAPALSTQSLAGGSGTQWACCAGGRRRPRRGGTGPTLRACVAPGGGCRSGVARQQTVGTWVASPLSRAEGQPPGPRPEPTEEAQASSLRQ